MTLVVIGGRRLHRDAEDLGWDESRERQLSVRIVSVGVKLSRTVRECTLCTESANAIPWGRWSARTCREPLTRPRNAGNAFPIEILGGSNAKSCRWRWCGVGWTDM